LARRGISSVVASIVLSGIVLVIGASVWAFSRGAAVSAAETYVNETLSVVNDINERLMVENVYYNETTGLLYIWIFNYGDVDLVCDVYVFYNGEQIASTLNHSIDTDSLYSLSIDPGISLTTGDWIDIQVHSRRQNDAFYEHYIS